MLIKSSVCYVLPMRANATRNVAELQTIFPASFAVYGTALGSLREQNIIEHDLDTDIGIRSEDFTWEAVNEAVRCGFEISFVFGMRHYGMEITFVRDGEKTDLMLFYSDPERPGKVFNCLWENEGKDGMANRIIHEYDEAMFKIQEGKLGDITIRTLGEDYVRHVYGENWRTPVKTWNWRTDHLCRKIG